MARLDHTAVVAAMVEGYEEQANSLKLILPAGDIDFVAAGTVTSSEPIEMLQFQNYSFPLETTEEILAKKLFYRPESFKGTSNYSDFECRGAGAASSAFFMGSDATVSAASALRLFSSRLESFRTSWPG